MPKITFVDKDGTRREVEAKSGDSVMMAALGANIRGIEAECGGSMICGTCHVFVDESFAAKLPALSTDEDDVLEGVATSRRPNSRLSCQIDVSPAIDGLVVQLPDRQVR